MRSPSPSSRAASRQALADGSGQSNSPLSAPSRMTCSSTATHASSSSSEIARSAGSRRPAPQASIQRIQLVVARRRHELAHDLVEAAGRGPRTGGQPAGPGDVALGSRTQHLGEQLVLAGEVVVDQATADPAGRGDVGDPGLGEPALEDDALGGLEQLGPTDLHLLGAALRAHGLGHDTDRTGRRCRFANWSVNQFFRFAGPCRPTLAGMVNGGAPTGGGRVELVAPEAAVRRARRRRRHRPRHPRRRVLQPARAVRLREDHDAADDRRLRAADRPARSCSTASTWRTPRRTSGRSTPSSRAMRCSRTSTVERNVAYGLRWRRDLSKDEQGEPAAAGAVARPARRARASASRTRCPAASSSASRWPAPWSSSRRVLLLDEPLGALDAKLRTSLRAELTGLQREVGITFVFVTHDQGEALEMSDRLAVMDGGRVVQCGAPRDVYEQPRGGVRRRLPRRGQPLRRRTAPRPPAPSAPCSLGQSPVDAPAFPRAWPR